MAFYSGADLVTKQYYNDQAISKLYVGSTLFWEASIEDELYIYIPASNDANDQFIRKIDKANMTYMDSPYTGSTIDSMVSDRYYVYVASVNGAFVKKYTKSTMALAATLIHSTPNCILINSSTGFIFVGSYNTNITKYAIANFVYVSEIPSTTGIMGATNSVIDDTYIYIQSNTYLNKYSQSTMSLISSTYAFSNFNIVADADYIYGIYSNYVVKVLKTTLANVAQSQGITDAPVLIAISGNYIFTHSNPTTASKKKLSKFLISDMSLVLQSYGYVYATALKADLNFVYTIGTGLFNRYTTNSLIFTTRGSAPNDTSHAGYCDVHNCYTVTNMGMAYKFQRSSLNVTDQLTLPAQGNCITATSVAFWVGSYQYIYKYNNFVAGVVSPFWDCDIQAITYANTYIYAGGSTQKIRKYNSETLAYVSESADFGAVISSIVTDGTYLYVSGIYGTVVKKYLASTLAYVSSSPAISYPNALAFDSTYLYVGGLVITKLLKSTMAYVSSSPTFSGSMIYGLFQDGTYLYAVGEGYGYLLKYSQSTMAYVGESSDYYMNGWLVDVKSAYDDKLYVLCRNATESLVEINKTTLVTTLPYFDIGYTGTITAIV